MKEYTKIETVYNRAEDGSNKEAIEIAVKALEQTDGDLISRQAVKDLIRGLTKWSVKSQDRKFENVGLLYDDVMFGIDRLPSADKTAEWIIHPVYAHLVCSECLSNAPYDCKTNYCPNCGRRMKGENQ